MRTVIIANLDQTQLDYLKEIAQEQGINAEFIVDSNQTTSEQRYKPETPITGQVLDEISAATGKTVLEVSQIANSLGLHSLEEALAHPDIPSEAKQVIESYI